jgi:adenosylhomocysteine nucleosidase
MAGAIKKLGIMTAMDEEFRLISNAFGATESRVLGPRTFYSAHFQGVDLSLVTARVGKVAAAVTTSLLIQEHKVDAILVVGVAGATTPAARIGDIVVADRLVQHDIDLKGVMGYQRFDIPLLNAREMRCCERLIGIAQGAGQRAVSSSAYIKGMRGFAAHEPTLHVGLIGSGDQFICDPGEKESLLAALPELACVEMEGAAVAQVCTEHGIPFVVARIISDAASQEAPLDFGAFIREAASVGSEAFVREFVQAVAAL